MQPLPRKEDLPGPVDVRLALAKPRRLGNIVYSNCFPVHARLIDQPAPGDPALVDGVPSELNRLLATGRIDVSPSSTVVYARSPERYLLLPELVIGSRGAVRSILLLSKRAPEDLGGRVIGLPSASATSVVLLKILLHIRWNVRPIFIHFDQAREDPFHDGADAALFIGDIALRPDLHPQMPVRIDLGEEWWRETGLPFAFALWQAGRDIEPRRLDFLRRRLIASRNYTLERLDGFSSRYAEHFGLDADFLLDYWRGLSYHLDGSMIEGLRTFYRLAADRGEIPGSPMLHWLG